MHGKIGFKQLKISCIIGDYPEERAQEQEIVVSVKVVCDLSACAQTDDLSDTVDYVAIAALCQKEAVQGQYRMLETYACRTLDKLLQQFPIQSAWILVEKPMGLSADACAWVELSKEKR